MRKILLTLFALTALASLGACHKTCTCVRYDGASHTFSADEVDAIAGGNCDDMIIQAGIRYYTVCNWD